MNGKDLFAQLIPAEWYVEKASTCFARSYNGEGSLYCPNCGSNIGSIWKGDEVPVKAKCICFNCEDKFVPNETAMLELNLREY